MNDLVEFEYFVFRRSEIKGIEKELCFSAPQLKIYVIIDNHKYKVVSKEAHWDTQIFGNHLEQLNNEFEEVKKKVFGGVSKFKRSYNV